MILKWLFLKLLAFFYFGWRKGDSRTEKQIKFIKFSNTFFKPMVPYHVYESYDKYLESYSTSTIEFSIYNQINHNSNWLKKKNILDLGGGCGYYSKRLLEEGAASATLIEVQKRKTDYAHKHFGNIKNFKIVNENAYEMPFQNKSFDSIFSHTVFEHIIDMEKLLNECHRVLTDDGVMMIGFNYFHHYGGSHLFPYIHFPWANWLVDEDVLCAYWSNEVLKDIEKGWSYYDKTCTASHLGAGSEMNLNRMTFEDFEKALENTGFYIEKKRASGMLVKLLPFLKYIPKIKFPLTGTVFYAIKKMN